MLAQRIDSNIFGKVMPSLFQTDDMNRLASFRYLRYPRVEKTEDGVVKVHCLRRDEKSHPVRSHKKKRILGDFLDIFGLDLILNISRGLVRLLCSDLLRNI